MAEKKPCRWSLLMRQASVLGRFKNKLRLKKLEWKRFYEEFFGRTHPTTASEAEFREWADSNHEGSSTSNYNSQYFDSLTPEQAFELYQLEQIGSLPSFEPGQTSVPGMSPLGPSSFQQDSGMHAQGGDQFQPLMEGIGSVDAMLLSPPRQASGDGEQTQTPWMDHMDSFYSAPLSVSEYVDAENDTVSEWLKRERSMSPMSIDTMRNMDMKDTGHSSTLPMTLEDRLQWYKQFFEIGAEEALTGPQQRSTGRGWRVMVRIVCACRKLSKLLRMKKLDKNRPGQVIVKKRIKGFGENRSQLYKGVRRRNGKWVSEIRVGQTNEKVWLGSYDTEKEAARAFDAGKYHCSAKKCRRFNFPDSPRLLGPPINLRGLSPTDRKKTIQRLAEDHAKACALANL